MDDPLFLSFEDVCRLHSTSLRLFGGSEGIRDRGGIESAIGAALNTFHYGQGDLYDVAAAYAFHIAQAQAFLDGNKRTGIASALIFLKMNGVPARPTADTQELIYDAMIGIAEKRLDKGGLAELFRRLFS